MGALQGLMILLKGMFTAVSAVSYTLGLLVIITYVFSIALVQLAPYDPEAEENVTYDSYFSSVPLAIYSLFVYLIFGDNLAEFAGNGRDDDAERFPISFILCVIFLVLGQMTVLNMLIGVLVGVISTVKVEEEEGFETEKVKTKFSGLLETYDENHNGKISWSEFKNVVGSEAAIAALQDVDVDPYGLIDAAEDIFFEDGPDSLGPNKPKVALDFQDFMELILDLKNSKRATVKDVVAMGKKFSKKMTQVKDLMGQIETKLKVLSE